MYCYPDDLITTSNHSHGLSHHTTSQGQVVENLHDDMYGRFCVPNICLSTKKKSVYMHYKIKRMHTKKTRYYLYLVAKL